MNNFLGQIMLVPYNFAPSGWAFCQGQLMPVNQFTALFSLLGTQFGGDGRSTFALPNLQGRSITGVGQGPGLQNYVAGQTAGETSVTLLGPNTPTHTHQQQGSSGVGTANPTANVFYQGAGREHGVPYYVTAPTGSQVTAMNQGALQYVGNGQPHNNQMPYLVLNYIIALTGNFPPRP